MSASVAIPELTTERLLLRPFQQRDFEDYAALVGDPDVARHVGDGRPLDRAGAWRHLAMLVGHWHLRQCGMWAVELAEEGAMIGRAGLLYPEGWPALELAWAFRPAFWNRGLATEAAAAAMRWAFEEHGADRLISMIRPDNPASIRVAEKLGMRPAETLTMLGGPVLVYARDRRMRQASP